jgi:hypothetical protein
MGQNNLSSIKNYFATDYMLETIFFVYCLLFINTFYLYKLDVSKNNILLNSQNNDTTISSKLMDIQSAGNQQVSVFTLVGSSETARQLPVGMKSRLNFFNVVRSFHTTRAIRTELHNTQEINPYFVTGFTDAEGSFIIRIIKSSGYRLG